MPTLILVRHGQSQWNLENRFTGWWDVDLTEKGVAEATAAGALLAAKDLLPTQAFTSLQTRAIKTLHLALEACGRLWIPETKDWRLNERHYGGPDRARQGRDRGQARRRAGQGVAPQLRRAAAGARTRAAPTTSRPIRAMPGSRSLRPRASS